jgi:hypothetical protein
VSGKKSKTSPNEFIGRTLERVQLALFGMDPTLSFDSSFGTSPNEKYRASHPCELVVLFG